MSGQSPATTGAALAPTADQNAATAPGNAAAAAAPADLCSSHPAAVVHHAGGLEGSQQQQQLPVLIAGAGPVGLTAAAFLASWRVPVRIVDSRPAPTDLSKALVTWRRSLATLDPLVPCDEWLEEAGVVVEGVAFADEGRVFASMELGGTPGAAAAAAAEAPGSATTQQQQQQHMLPPGILTPQSEVEARLDRVLQRCGVVVERGMQLTAFSVDDDGGCVRCSLAKTSGGSSSALLGSSGDPQEVCGASQVEEVAASVLIGADGARSAVRKGLGCAFDGFTRTGDHWLLADVRFEVQPGINSHAPTQPAEEQPQPGRLLLTTTNAGTFGLIPLGRQADVIRLVWNAGSSAPAEPSLDDFQRVLLQHTRLQLKLTACLWLSEFVVNERQVESYVHHNGRVLLAGDAAHVHSPAGGQGMNTGIQDAANLAWKVALAVSGGMADSHRLELLLTYQEERHPIGAAAVRASGMLLRTQSMRHPLLRLLRRLALSMLLPLARGRLLAALTEDNVEYSSSSLAAGAGRGAGTAFPDVIIIMVPGERVRPATDLLRGPGFGTLVLMIGGADRKQWPTHWGPWPLNVVRVASSAGAEGPAPDAVDAWGLLAAVLRCQAGEGVLVRPDSMIAASGSPAAVRGWLERHCGFSAAARDS